MLDIRYIYIGKTTADKRLVKIGIATDVHARWRDIDKSIAKSKEKPIAYFKVLNASKLEVRLHRRFKSKRVDFKGSGKTEWFALSLLERLSLYFITAIHGAVFAVTLLALLACILITAIVIIL